MVIMVNDCEECCCCLHDFTFKSERILTVTCANYSMKLNTNVWFRVGLRTEDEVCYGPLLLFLNLCVDIPELSVQVFFVFVHSLQLCAQGSDVGLQHGLQLRLGFGLLL